MKKVRYNGKDYISKWLIEVGIFPKHCGFKKRSEIIAYDAGIIMIRLKSGIVKFYFTDGTENTVRFCFYDMNGPEDEIIFEDKEIEEAWCALYVYMFKEDGAFLLYTDRKIMDSVGVRARIGNEESLSSVKQEAFNVAAFFSEELVKALLSMEEEVRKRGSSLTLLSVGEEYGE